MCLGLMIKLEFVSLSGRDDPTFAKRAEMRSNILFVERARLPRAAIASCLLR